MKCRDARAMFLAGEAGQAELDHLASCADCREQWGALDSVRTLLDDPALWLEPSPGLEDRVVALVSGTPESISGVRRVSRRGWWTLGGVAVGLVIVAVWVGAQLASPDWRVALPGTEAAPRASGEVLGWVESGGTRVALDVEGLPPAPPGSVYEFWFTNGEIHISAGTFIEPVGVELWVGVSRRDFPRLWITLEPIDEDESPSGINVMDTG
ncbi:MAG: anti-sigma factor [Acidimicrobiia bacterium]|nr:anti-sigma factor [Acidimicrobiia bacterium]NNL27052.1 anti-sigma factor [Acidimicrobiia bacterium]